MARRDRTTGLPRPHAAERPLQARPRLRLSEGVVRLGILGSAVALLLIVIGVFAWQWYREHVAMPRATVLTVGDRKVTLGYFTDRLPQFIVANGSTDVGIAVQGLLGKIEEEELTILLARELGLEPTQQDVTQSIAESLGESVGGKGSAFDRLYRQELRITGFSDGTYRRVAAARLANERLLDHYQEEVGTEGELLTLRVVAVADEAKANELKSRIEAGEDMGSIAQRESTDQASRQQDGLLDPQPLALLPDPVRQALTVATPGTLVGPLAVNDAFWVVRLERRERGSYTETQRRDLAQQRLDRALTELKSRTLVRRDLSSAETDWALRHADFPSGS
ncbi:MAG: peptidylprolyl isomerase [Chloroflexota bacterium]|nr:peptidylprolyl isomerase [Dehalococcoidia bacterium]MDW8047555.1 peptidylprolyl isomerase [Chloroflexota bacterium]